MIVLRCTRRLLGSGRHPVSTDPAPPTAPLGEWFANAVPLPLPGRWVVMYTSSQTLLTVVVPGRALRTTTAAFQERVPALLHRLGLPAAWIAQQRALMQEITVARTNDRRVLGTMTDLAFQIQHAAQEARAVERIEWDALELALARVPLGMHRYECPQGLVQRVATGEG